MDKTNNAFYAFTSQLLAAFVEIGIQLEAHVHLNGRQLVLIMAIVQMIETHSGLAGMRIKHPVSNEEADRQAD